MAGRTTFLKYSAADDYKKRNKESNSNSNIRDNQYSCNICIKFSLISFYNDILDLGYSFWACERRKEKCCNLTIANSCGNISDGNIEIVRTVQ